MKKLFTLLTFAVAGLTASADPIDAERAKQLAADFLQQDSPLTLVKQASRHEAKARKLSAATRATAPFYIYSRGAGQGYIIIAGDDCMPIVLGYTEQGDFDENNVPDALQDMFDAWTLMVEDAQANGTNTPKQEAKARRAAADRSNIAPLLTSHWHQDSPYNNHCPFLKNSSNRAITGCVATAACQVLYYWRKDLPSTLQGSTPTYSYGDAPVTESVPKGTELHWELMKDNHWNSDPAAVKDAVAEFCFATGAATWLTYGSSTSGHIEDIPYTYSHYYGMNGGTVHYRNSYSQESWVQLLYKELLAHRPVMYTGVHPDQGGHAVVIHGYKTAVGTTSDLFYFNFGWGGQGDGYYTVDTSNGMNGFKDYQSALIGAIPKQWNMDINVRPAAGTVYAQRTNDFEVTIQNNSTIAHSGFYLFAATSKSNPKALKDAKSSDTETIVAKGETATLTLSCKPTSTKTWYITLTDANLNVLKQIEVVPEVAPAELSLIDIAVNGSADTDTIDGIAYHRIYNDRASVTVHMLNAGSIDYEGTARIDIFALNDSTGEWTKIGNKSASNSLLPARQVTPVTIGVSNTSNCPIEPGKRYCAEVTSPWSTTVSKDTIDFSQAENLRTYFTLTGESDLTVADFQDNILYLKGHWDKVTFENIVKRPAYKTAQNYDLTAVESFTDNYDPTYLTSPNSLVFAPEHQTFQTPNILSGTQMCPNLSLQAGYDFMPTADFTAWNATLRIGSEVGLWYMVTVPFAAYVPDGIIARRIDSHRSSGLSTKNVVDVDTLQAGCTYMVMASSLRNMNLVSTPGAKSVHVAAKPAVNPDTAIIGTYVLTPTPDKAQLLNDEEKQYFVPVEEGTLVEGLRGYFYDEKVTKTFRAYPSILIDPAYVNLAKAIQQAYEILDAYSDSVTQRAYNAYSDSINAAEHEFSHRAETTLTTPALINAYAEHLLQLGEEYKLIREDENPAGDVNGDGKLDLSDITDLISIYLSNTQPEGLDLDGDGVLTIEDIAQLIALYLGE